ADRAAARLGHGAVPQYTNPRAVAGPLERVKLRSRAGRDERLGAQLDSELLEHGPGFLDGDPLPIDFDDGAVRTDSSGRPGTSREVQPSGKPDTGVARARRLRPDRLLTQAERPGKPCDYALCRDDASGCEIRKLQCRRYQLLVDDAEAKLAQLLGRRGAEQRGDELIEDCVAVVRLTNDSQDVPFRGRRDWHAHRHALRLHDDVEPPQPRRDDLEPRLLVRAVLELSNGQVAIRDRLNGCWRRFLSGACCDGGCGGEHNEQ